MLFLSPEFARCSPSVGARQTEGELPTLEDAQQSRAQIAQISRVAPSYTLTRRRLLLPPQRHLAAILFGRQVKRKARWVLAGRLARASESGGLLAGQTAKRQSSPTMNARVDEFVASANANTPAGRACRLACKARLRGLLAINSRVCDPPELNCLPSSRWRQPGRWTANSSSLSLSLDGNLPSWPNPPLGESRVLTRVECN